MVFLAWPFYLLIPAFVLLHLAESPYTKVEESFNIQAIHDILIHGIPRKNFDQFLTANYDHVSFPGSVPRTFVGALALSGLSKPFLLLTNSTFQLQLVIRGVLGLINAFSLIALGRNVEKAFGTAAGIWYALFQASQFHVIYYASRTLPNMFAFVFSNLALASLLKASAIPWDARTVTSNYRRSLYYLTIAGVIFRSELAILVATFTVYLFITHKLSITGAIIPAGLGGLMGGLICTVPIDSFFWQSFPLWPEWTAFYYNTIQGHSADWGVSPWHFYFANSLPRLLLNPVTYLITIPVAVLNAATRRRSLDLLIPMLSFVGLYSFLPHKEWRFIIYVIPGLTAVGGAGAGWIWNRRGKNAIYAILSLALVGSVLCSFVASTGLLLISGLNYPGGEALNFLHKGMEHPPGHYQVYFDNLACQTGVTRFLESHEGPQTVLDVLDHKEAESQRTWTYDKTEDPVMLRDPLFWAKFTYVLTESPERVIGSWNIVHTVYGFSGIRVLKPVQPSTAAVDPMDDGELLVWDWTYEVASFWREMEKKLRPVLGGYWVKIKMEPKIRVLRNGMSSIPEHV